MKRYVLSIIFVLTFGMTYGQFSDIKSIWFYINIYPEKGDKILGKIKIAKEIYNNDTANICNEILNSENSFVVFDNTVLKFNYTESLFNNSVFQLKENLCDTLTFGFYDKKVKSKKAMSIITKKGLIIIYNLEKSLLFINIKEKHIAALNQSTMFLVDNRLLEFYFDKSEYKWGMGGIDFCGTVRCVLESHMYNKLRLLNNHEKNWEINSSKSLIIDNKEFLLWSVKSTDNMDVIADKQYFLTTLSSNGILVLKVTGKKHEKGKSIEKYFKKNHFSIYKYLKSDDVNQILIKIINE